MIIEAKGPFSFSHRVQKGPARQRMYHIADTELEMELLPLIVLLLFGKKTGRTKRRSVIALSNLQPPLKCIIINGISKEELC